MAEYDRRMREGERLSPFGFPEITAKQALDLPLDSLIMPRLITEDTLRPEQDTAYMELLDKLKENGVPIPLRIWASAAGYDLDKAMAMMEEDILIKKRLYQLGSGEGGESSDLGGGGSSDDLFGGGGESSSPEGGGGGGQSAKDLFPSGGGEEGASNRPGSSATLPPKWGYTAASTRKHLDQVDATLNVFRKGHDPYVKLLAKIAPNLLADLRVPAGRELMPYTSD